MKIGSRVRAIKHLSSDFLCSGKSGEIIDSREPSFADENRGTLWAVVFDEPFVGGHGLEGRCDFGHGLWIYEDILTMEYDNEDWV